MQAKCGALTQKNNSTKESFRLTSDFSRWEGGLVNGEANPQPIWPVPVTECHIVGYFRDVRRRLGSSLFNLF